MADLKNIMETFTSGSGEAGAIPGFKPEDILKTLLEATESKRVVTDIVVVMDSNEKKAKSSCPPGYTRIDADLNKGSGGRYIYLCVRYENILAIKAKSE